MTCNQNRIKPFITVCLFCIVWLSIRAVAIADEHFYNEIPSALEAAFSDPEWKEYVCVEGASFHPISDTDSSSEGNIAFLIMLREQTYTFCILEQEDTMWQWRTKTDGFLLYEADVVPVITLADDTNWAWIQYNFPNGCYREYTLIRFDGLNWYLARYTQNDPQTQDAFTISIDSNEYFARYFDVADQFYGDREKIAYEWKRITGMTCLFRISNQRNGYLYYDKQLFWGEMDLDLNVLNFSDFPSDMHQALNQLSKAPLAIE